MTTYTVLYKEACDLLENGGATRRMLALRDQYRALFPGETVEAGVAGTFKDHRGFTTLVVEVRKRV